jgi:hypothetical protein
MQDSLDGAAEGVFAAEEGCFVGKLGGFGFACSVIGATSRGGF